MRMKHKFTVLNLPKETFIAFLFSITLFFHGLSRSKIQLSKFDGLYDPNVQKDHNLSLLVALQFSICAKIAAWLLYSILFSSLLLLASL